MSASFKGNRTVFCTLIIISTEILQIIKMTHSNGVEDKDVGGAMPTAGHTRRFTLHLSDHTRQDYFDEFSYMELQNSDLVSECDQKV